MFYFVVRCALMMVADVAVVIDIAVCVIGVVVFGWVYIDSVIKYSRVKYGREIIAMVHTNV